MAIGELDAGLGGNATTGAPIDLVREELGIPMGIETTIAELPHTEATSAQAKEVMSGVSDEEYSRFREWARTGAPLVSDSARFIEIDQANEASSEHAGALSTILRAGEGLLARLGERLDEGTHNFGGTDYVFSQGKFGPELMSTVGDDEIVFAAYVPESDGRRSAHPLDYAGLITDVLASVEREVA